MGNVVNKKFDPGVITFTFSDNDGVVFSKFRMNPTDIKLMSRAMEVADYFEKIKNEVNDMPSDTELAKYNDEIERKINYLLGYEASDEVFGNVSAITVSPDGEIFAMVLLDTILEKIVPEIEKRGKNMQTSMGKYTDKYTK